MKINFIIFFAIITLLTNTSFAKDKDKEVILKTEKPADLVIPPKFYQDEESQKSSKKIKELKELVKEDPSSKRKKIDYSDSINIKENLKKAKAKEELEAIENEKMRKAQEQSMRAKQLEMNALKKKN